MKQVFSVLAVLLFAACTDHQPILVETEQAASARIAEETSAARQPSAVNSKMLVATDELAAFLGDPSTLVVHVGSASDYAAGHIPGARFLPFSALHVTRDGIPFELPDVASLEAALEAAGISDRSRVVLYGGWGGLQAARAFFTLDYLGHTHVALLDGGLEAWRAEGRPLSTEAPPAAAGSFTPRERHARLVTAEWILNRLQDEEQEDTRMVLIDARPAAAYEADHLPGASSIPWPSTQIGSGDLRLKDVETLRTLYAAAGADSGTEVVAYCWSGMMSSFAYFVARYLDLDVKLYDGSYIDWTGRGLPLE